MISINAINSRIGFQGGHVVNIGAGQNKKEGGFNISDNGINLGVQPMETKSDFPKAIAEALKNQLINDKESKPVIWMALPGAQGRDKNRQYAAPPNIVGRKDQIPVGKIYISEIEKAIQEIRPDAELTVTNDGMMQAYQDMRDPEVKAFLDENVDEGESFIGRFGAGGCGGYTGIKTDKGLQIIPMEIGHTRIPLQEVNMDYVFPGMQTPESYAGCAPAAIRVFALELGFTPADAAKLSDTVEGRIVTNDIVELDTNDPEQKAQAKALKATGLFVNNGNKFHLIDPQTNKPISHERRVQGLKAAAGEYFKSIGIMLADGANHLSNTMILTAGFDSHLAKAAREDAGMVGKNDPEQIIKDTAFRNIDRARQAAIGEPENFNVLIKDTGDPGDPKNAELMANRDVKVIGGFRIGVIPKKAL